MQEQLSDAYQQTLKALRDAGPETAEDERPAPPSRETAGGLSDEDSSRVEDLFLQAATDRAKAFELKTELDRLGVFRHYEDRFLSLFKSP